MLLSFRNLALKQAVLVVRVQTEPVVLVRMVGMIRQSSAAGLLCLLLVLFGNLAEMGTRPSGTGYQRLFGRRSQVLVGMRNWVLVGMMNLVLVGTSVQGLVGTWLGLTRLL